jgi:hypothetical protein
MGSSHDLLRDKEKSQGDHQHGDSGVLDENTDAWQVITDFTEATELTVLHI